VYKAFDIWRRTPFLCAAEKGNLTALVWLQQQGVNVGIL